MRDGCHRLDHVRQLPAGQSYQSTYGGSQDAVVTLLNSAATGLVFSTYLGGSGSYGVAVDPSGNVFVAGSTASSNFPFLNAFQSTYAGNTDAFVSEFTSAGGLAYSSFLGGGQQDIAYAIVVDSSSSAVIAGSTISGDFPIRNASPIWVIKLPLTVDGALGATGAYGFRLWDLAQAAPLTPGAPVSGALDPANETDLYRFDAAAADRFFFDVQQMDSALSGARWRLFDRYGNRVFNQSLGDVLTLAVAAEGTYTLLVEGNVGGTGSGNYTFNVQPVTSTTEPLPLGETVSGSIVAPGEQRRYTFSLPVAAQLVSCRARYIPTCRGQTTWRKRWSDCKWRILTSKCPLIFCAMRSTVGRVLSS